MLNLCSDKRGNIPRRTALRSVSMWRAMDTRCCPINVISPQLGYGAARPSYVLAAMQRESTLLPRMVCVYESSNQIKDSFIMRDKVSSTMMKMASRP